MRTLEYFSILKKNSLFIFWILFFRTSQPLFLGRLIRYFTQQQIKNDEEKVVSTDNLITLEQAYWYAGGVILCSTLSVIIMHPYMMGVFHIGMKIRVGCCSLIYRKVKYIFFIVKLIMGVFN